MIKDFVKEVLPIVRKTRDITLPHYGNVEAIRQKEKSAHTVVTELDEKVETFLRTELAKLDPSIGFVGEEFGGNRDAERFWISDPIDGTVHFIRGLPFCTTMLALIDKGEPVFSVIYDFINDVCYYAEKEKGAYKDGEPISVSDRPIESSYMGWESHIEKPENMERYLKLKNKSLLLKTISAGYEYILVATGKIEGRVNFDPYGKDYDFAPGALLVREAGGVVANIGAQTYDYRNTDILAANPKVFKAFTEGPEAIFPILK